MISILNDLLSKMHALSMLIFGIVPCTPNVTKFVH